MRWGRACCGAFLSLQLTHPPLCVCLAFALACLVGRLFRFLQVALLRILVVCVLRWVALGQSVLWRVSVLAAYPSTALCQLHRVVSAKLVGGALVSLAASRAFARSCCERLALGSAGAERAVARFCPCSLPFHRVVCVSFYACACFAFCKSLALSCCERLALGCGLEGGLLCGFQSVLWGATCSWRLVLLGPSALLCACVFSVFFSSLCLQ